MTDADKWKVAAQVVANQRDRAHDDHVNAMIDLAAAREENEALKAEIAEMKKVDA